MLRWIQLSFAPALLAMMLLWGGDWVAGTSAGEGIDAFPPMPSDHPRGASSTSRAISAALGRGVNFGDVLDAPNEGDWGLILRDEFIDVTAQAGFTSVRLPVRWSNHTAATAPFTIAPAFLSRVESVLTKLLAKGLYVVLDMHHYRQLDGDAIDSGEFPVDGALLDVRFAMIWQQIAEHFRGKSAHLLFELYNTVDSHPPSGTISQRGPSTSYGRAIRAASSLSVPQTGTARMPSRLCVFPMTQISSSRFTTTSLSTSLIRGPTGYSRCSPPVSGAATQTNKPRLSRRCRLLKPGRTE